MSQAFHYQTAFSRNLGWLNTAEQSSLQGKRIAIAGMGGVGGSHLLTLTRLGVGAFHLADMDHFELANFNRQAGAMNSTLEQAKVDIMAGMARDINPELEIKTFPQGVTEQNLDAFLEGVDLYVDALDFFAVKIRRQVFSHCYQHNIPAITAAPLGMGAAFLAFIPGKMSFEDYFCLDGQSENEQLLRFLLGLAPARLHTAYLVEPERVDLANHKGPSTVMACELCAGIVGSEALKLLLGRGKVVHAPHGLHFDAYRNRLKKTWRPWGNRNPWQQLLLWFGRRQFGVNNG